MTKEKINLKKSDLKAELVTEPEKPVFLSILIYSTFAVLFILYGSFVYFPNEFQTYSEKYQVLQPLNAFFQAVEKYSPFHEFLEDEKFKKSTQHNSENKPSDAFKERIFTKEELKEYDGSKKGKGPYLAILGQVFDVTKGKNYYSPEGGYGFFSGKDGSRAFITGEFNKKGLIDDISGLSTQDYLGLKEWIEFYHKDYKYIGKLVGRFYDESGNPTAYAKEAEGWIADAQIDQDKKSAEMKMFPPCNSEWSKAKGQRVWCTKKSGGIDREWEGRPRRLFYPGRTERCACVKDIGPPSTDKAAKSNNGDLSNPHVKEYEGCDYKALSCQTSPPENDDDDN